MKISRLPCHKLCQVWAQDSCGTQHKDIPKMLQGGIKRHPTALSHVINELLNSQWLTGKLVTFSQVLDKVTELRNLCHCTCPVQPLLSRRVHFCCVCNRHFNFALGDHCLTGYRCVREVSSSGTDSVQTSLKKKKKVSHLVNFFFSSKMS